MMSVSYFPLKQGNIIILPLRVEFVSNLLRRMGRQRDSNSGHLDAILRVF